MPYDSVKDITPISVIGTTPLVMVVAENSPYRTIGDLLAAARAQPGKINYGASGNGSVLHLAGELLKSKAGVDMMHIPYRGGNALITDVMSGQIQVAFLAVPSVLAQVQAGKLHALAVSTPQRVAALPDVPTLTEAGIKDMVVYSWQGFAVPKGTPPAVVQQLSKALQTALRDPKTAQTLQGLGFEVVANTPQQFTAFQQGEVKRWKDVIQKANIQLE
ncbi:hypothetical protein G6F31_016219 [Rhizopus arrhizus]|nr:hypothetical protein G6F31_016219 [Rhizopus arrhizus]